MLFYYVCILGNKSLLKLYITTLPICIYYHVGNSAQRFFFSLALTDIRIVLQTIQMNLVLFCFCADLTVLGITQTAKQKLNKVYATNFEGGFFLFSWAKNINLENFCSW